MSKLLKQISINERRNPLLFSTINKLCFELPPGYQVYLVMENGAALIDCCDKDGRSIKLSYVTKNTELVDQLNNALIAAKSNYEKIKSADLMNKKQN